MAIDEAGECHRGDSGGDSSMNKPSDNLIAALNIIDTPGCWTKGAFARSASGVPVPIGNKNATCFCSLGAVKKVTGSVSSEFWQAKEYMYLSIAVLHTDSPKVLVDSLNDTAESPFTDEMGTMWMGAIFSALANEE